MIKQYIYLSQPNILIKAYTESQYKEFTWNLTDSLIRSGKKKKSKNLQPKKKKKENLEISLRITSTHSACQKQSTIKIISYKIMNLVFSYG